MRIERLCVRRLKSFMDYSNVAVELCASLGDGDDVETVYTELLLQVNALIRRTRTIEESEELQKRIHQEEEKLMKQIEALRALLAELSEQKKQLELALEDARQFLERSSSIRQKLLALVRR